MNVVLPFWSGDVDQAKALLEWAIELDGTVPNTGVLVFDDKTDGTEVAKLAVEYFKEVVQLRIDSPFDRTWPKPQNHYFQRTAFQYSLKKSLNGSPWLWWETDAWPLTKGWLATIEAAYKTGKMPFMGPVVRPQGYTAGVSVYPGKVTEFFTDAMLIKTTPWDVVSQKDVRGKVCDSSAIMQHERDGGSFRCKSDLSRIRPGVVLYHRCKDTSLVSVIRGGEVSKFTAPEPGIDWSKIPHYAPSVEGKRSVCIHRDSAIGDVIMASGIVRKLALEGHDASLWCRDVIAPLFEQDECVLTVESEQAGQDLVDLNGVYEGHPDIKTVPKPVLMANKCHVEPFNITPVLRYAPMSSGLSHPRIAISPRSNSWAVRTVPKSIWEKVNANATLIWVGSDDAPKHMVDAKCRNIRQLASVIASCDGMISVDTGPMHIAAALGKPVMAIGQACAPDLHLRDQRDFRTISTGLSCLNCHLGKCPVNELSPPCGTIDPFLISDAIDQMVETMNGKKVSAIIPIYKPNVARLNECLKAALPQVQEIIIGIDGDGIKPNGVITDHRIKWVSNPTGQRRGFGKTCNHAARHSTGTYLLMLNDDVFLDPYAVANMMDVMLNDPKVGVVGAFLLYPDGRIQHGGTFRSTSSAGWGHIDHRGNTQTIKSVTEMENVTHACALIRRRAFYDVLGYDEEFDCYWEDNALNLAIRQAGYKVMYQPGAKAIHHESQTTSPMKNELAAKGQKVFEKKWLWYFEKNRNNQMGVFA